jgi:tetratricopeptide (TPR) repeat protein
MKGGDARRSGERPAARGRPGDRGRGRSRAGERPLSSRLRLPAALLLAGVLLLAAGCGTARKRIYGVDELREVLGDRLADEADETLVVPFEVTPEIVAAARQATRGLPDDYSRAVALIELILDQSRVAATYEALANKTAVETFRGGSANCLSLTNLFIGMARSLGMEVVYVDVTQIEELLEEGDYRVHTGHICAGLFHGNSFALIDFAGVPRKNYVRFRIIDDIEAVANYYNNLGFELARLRAEGGCADIDPDADIVNYERATRIMPGFAKAYNNLGVAYARRGRYPEAERAYRRAIELDPTLGEAYGNLGNLLLARRDLSTAPSMYQKAARYSSSAYYYLYKLGTAFYLDDDPDGAVRSFRRALRRRRSFAPAWIGLALALQQKGDLRGAEQALKSALRHDPENLEARRRLELLQRRLAGEPVADSKEH